MNSSQLFSGRAYVFDDEKIVDKNEAAYEIVEEIISKSKIDIKIESLVELFGNENFDDYKIISGDLLYSLKISLDDDCFILKNESEFLKNNKSPLVPRLLDSGKIRIGNDILFLLSSYEEGYDTRDEGILSIIENDKSFFYTLRYFSKLKSKTSCRAYLDAFMNKTKITKESEILKKSISSIHEIDKIERVFSLLYEEVFSNYDETILEGDEACHGCLDLDNIVTRHGLYKYKNLGFNFSGNSLFDVCYLAVSSGMSKRYSFLLFKKYCEFNQKEIEPLRLQYDYCMRITSCLFFSKLFFDYLIEETIFQTRRPHKLLSLSVDFSKCYHNIERISCGNEIKYLLSEIITRPITDKEK
jgi:hypothetical protein